MILFGPTRNYFQFCSVNRIYIDSKFTKIEIVNCSGFRIDSCEITAICGDVGNNNDFQRLKKCIAEKDFSHDIDTESR